jgi:hypothetical protein
MAKRKVAPEVPGEDISVAPVRLSTRAMIKKRPAMTRVMRAGDLKKLFALLEDLAELFAELFAEFFD